MPNDTTGGPMPSDVRASDSDRRAGESLRPPSRWKRPVVNMTGPERLVRVLAGILLAVAGGWAIGDWVQGVVAVLVWVLLVIGVVDLVVSGLVGYCPIYRFVRAPGTRRNAS